MAVIKSNYIFIALAILANNLIWIYATQEKPLGQESAVARVATERKFNTTPHNSSHNAPYSDNLLSNANAVNKVSNTVSSSISSDKNKNVPSDADTRNTDLPSHLSQDIIYENIIDKEQFFFNDKNKKLDTVNALSAQGDDIKLLANILKNEADADIKKAALKRLTQEQSYAATNILLEALDDPATDVALTALQTIVNNGDRTLLPLLREKSAAIANRSTRELYENSIHELEYSVVMGMDNITAPQ